MGKAIVINGLNVTNPLTTVTLFNTPAEAELKSYFEKIGNNITSTEKTALIEFVNELIDKGVWSKFKYFYPLLGGSVSDMILDVVEPSTEDLFTTSGTTGLSVKDRMLVATERPQSDILVGSRAAQLNTSKLSMICSGFVDKQIGGGQLTCLRGTDNTLCDFILSSASSVYRNMGWAGVNSDSDYSQLTSRICCGITNNATGYIYLNNELLNSGTPVIPSDVKYTYGFLSNFRTAGYNFTFTAIGEDITPSDWTTKIYPALLTFLQAVGKHE